MVTCQIPLRYGKRFMFPLLPHVSSIFNFGFFTFVNPFSPNAFTSPMIPVHLSLQLSHTHGGNSSLFPPFFPLPQLLPFFSLDFTGVPFFSSPVRGQVVLLRAVYCSSQASPPQLSCRGSRKINADSYFLFVFSTS